MIDLKTPCLRKVPIGTQIKTTKGFVWQLKERDGDKESWLDDTTGLIWSDPRVSGINHHQAVEQFGDKLPTKEQYKEAEEHGIREVMDLNNRWFWSSSVYPNNAYNAYDFNGCNGDIDNYYRYYSNNIDAALCVQRNLNETD